MCERGEIQRAAECARRCQRCRLQKGIRLTSLIQPACQLADTGRGVEGGVSAVGGERGPDEKNVGKEEREKALSRERDKSRGWG